MFAAGSDTAEDNLYWWVVDDSPCTDGGRCWNEVSLIIYTDNPDWRHPVLESSCSASPCISVSYKVKTKLITRLIGFITMHMN